MIIITLPLVHHFHDEDLQHSKEGWEIFNDAVGDSVQSFDNFFPFSVVCLDVLL